MVLSKATSLKIPEVITPRVDADVSGDCGRWQFSVVTSDVQRRAAVTLAFCLIQAALQVGGHGERLHQCREVVLTTYKTIPMQVDGEPCRLSPSVIRISLRNQANMVQKCKRRTSMPLLNE